MKLDKFLEQNEKFEKIDEGVSIKITYNNVFEVVEFNKDDKRWKLSPEVVLVSHDYLVKLMKFLLQSETSDWIQEKRYNIIIGQDTDTTRKKSAYFKCFGDDYQVDTVVDDMSLTIDEDYIFTEDEIEELKSKSSESIQKIIEIGKVEIDAKN